MDFTLLLSPQTRNRANQYFQKISAGLSSGFKFSKDLANYNKDSLVFDDYLEVLFNTKLPQIFAESAIVGDGSDWNLEELAILGDISVAIPVDIYDNGNLNTPVVHENEFSGYLIYTPGALLCNGYNYQPADFNEVTSGELIDPEKYNKFYARRLAPVLKYINEQASSRQETAIITIPGLGCGQFAGQFRGQLGPHVKNALKELLLTIDKSLLSSIGTVYFDPYSDCENERETVNGVEFLVRPLIKDNRSKSQLNTPKSLSDVEGEFDNHTLYSIVAWDHVSWITGWVLAQLMMA